jgi:hypothetical protein
MHPLQQVLRYGDATDSSPRSLTVLPERNKRVRVPMRSNVLERTSTVIQKVTGVLNPSNLLTGK